MPLICKKDVTPLLTHWNYAFLALTDRYIIHVKVFVHDWLDIPQMEELAKSILPGMHTFASVSHSQVSSLIGLWQIWV